LDHCSSGWALHNTDDWGKPEQTFAIGFEVLDACMERLPPSLGRLFLMREWLEIVPEICKELSITPTNWRVPSCTGSPPALAECLNIRFGQHITPNSPTLKPISTTSRPQTLSLRRTCRQAAALPNYADQSFK
jgi:hypothetical protein